MFMTVLAARRSGKARRSVALSRAGASGVAGRALMLSPWRKRALAV